MPSYLVFNIYHAVALYMMEGITLTFVRFADYTNQLEEIQRPMALQCTPVRL